MTRFRPAVVVVCILGVLLLTPAGSPAASAAGCTQVVGTRSFVTASSNGTSSDPAVSGTGRYVAFDSTASNLLDDPFQQDSNGFADVFVQDREEQTMQLVSLAWSSEWPIQLWDPKSEWHNDDGSWDEPEDVAWIIERDLTVW